MTIVTVHSEHLFYDCCNATQWTLFITTVILHSGHFYSYCNSTQWTLFITVVTVYTGHSLQPGSLEYTWTRLLLYS